jgi:tRNA(adenine34) deaminase
MNWPLLLTLSVDNSTYDGTFRMACNYKVSDDLDRKMMTRCIDIAVRSGNDHEYPYGVILCLDGKVIAESTNRVAHERDVTRHAEIVVISQAQRILGTNSLSDCVIYVSAEPCVYCCYAIRESRIGRVVYGLHSPQMGGVSRWNVLIDKQLSDKLPEVFDPPPEVVAGFMAAEAEQALLDWNPLVWGLVMRRGLFTAGSTETVSKRNLTTARRVILSLLPFLRRTIFDRFGRWI